MSDSLRPLLSDASDHRIAEVLRAGLDDGPSAESAAWSARALGIGSAVALTAAAAASASATKAAGAGTGAASLLSVIAKWFALGALMGGVVSVPLVLQSAPASDSPTRMAASPRVVVATPSTQFSAPPVQEAPEPESPESRSTTPAAPLRAATTGEPLPAAAPALPPEASVAGFPSVPKSTLELEIAALDAARGALKSGNPAGALAAIDRYDRSASPHALAAEARLLRVQALVASGRQGEAASIARAVLSTGANDAYACRVAKLAGVSASGCPAALP